MSWFAITRLKLWHLQEIQRLVLQTSSAVVEAVSLDKIDLVILCQEQLKDVTWAEVIGYLEGGALPKSKLSSLDEFVMSNGVLYHSRSLPDRY